MKTGSIRLRRGCAATALLSLVVGCSSSSDTPNSVSEGSALEDTRTLTEPAGVPVPPFDPMPDASAMSAMTDDSDAPGFPVPLVSPDSMTGVDAAATGPGSPVFPPAIQPTFETLDLRRAENVTTREVCRAEYIALNDFFVSQSPDAIQIAREDYQDINDVESGGVFRSFGINVHWIFPNSPVDFAEGEAADNNSSGIFFAATNNPTAPCYTVAFEGFGLDGDSLGVERIFRNTLDDVVCFFTNVIPGSQVIATYPLYQVGDRGYGLYARDLRRVVDDQVEVYRQIYETRRDELGYHVTCPRPTRIR